MVKRTVAPPFSGMNPLSQNAAKDVNKKERPALPNSAKASSRQIDTSELSSKLESQLDDLGGLDALEGDLETNTLTHELGKASQDGVTSLTITHDGEDVHFEYEEIEPEDIETLTFPDEKNERIQRWLTPFVLRALVQKIKKTGQIYPALGYRLNGKIYIIDGSRRRKSCIYAHRPFKVYVSDIKFDESLCDALSQDANEHATPSLIEKGQRWTEMHASSGLSQAQFAKAESINPATLSTALKGARLPISIIDLFPSPPDIGAGVITKLDKSLSGLSANTVKSLVAAFSKKMEATDFQSDDGLVRNQQALSLFNQVVESVINPKGSTPVYKVYESFGNSVTKGKFQISDNGKATITMTNPSKTNVYDLLNLLASEYLPDNPDLIELIQKKNKS